MKATILALDSASSVCRVALLAQEGNSFNVFVAQHEGTAQHAERMLPLIEEVLAESNTHRKEISAVVFAQGPGGFTGLRVACGVAQGIAYALDIPVVPISSLLLIADQQRPLEQAESAIELVITDARMNELYLGAYQRTVQGWYSLHKPILITPEQLYAYIKQLRQDITTRKQNTSLRLSGDGLLAVPDIVSFAQEHKLLLGDSKPARVETLARLGANAFELNRGIDPSLAAPLYVRNRVAFTTVEREKGLGGNPAAQRQNYLIRAVRPSDLATIAQIEQGLQIEPWSLAQFEQSLQAGHLGWVALNGDEVVAYVFMMLGVAEAELLLIGVAPSAQRQGIAQQLLCFAEQEMRVRGARQIHLEVRASNLVAIALYEGADYYPVGRRKNYYHTGVDTPREEAILFTKQLA